MSAMVERIAKALARVDGYTVRDRYVHGGPMWRQYEDAALAVIRAMREPTEEMVGDAEQADDDLSRRQQESGGAGFGLGAAGIWRTMIDAALA